MTITFSLFSTVFVLAVIYALCRERQKRIRALFAFLMVLEANRILSTAAMVGSQEINISDFVLGALVLEAIFSLIGGLRIRKSMLLPIIVFAVTVGACIVLNILFPYDGYTVGSAGSWDAFYYGREAATTVGMCSKTAIVLIRLFLFLLLLAVLPSVFCSRDFREMGRIVMLSLKIHIVWGALECFCKNVFASDFMVELAQSVFPVLTSATSGIFERGGIPVLQGLTREPGHFACALTIYLLLVVLFRWKGASRVEDVMFSVPAVLLLLVSGAFTAIVGLVIVGILFLYCEIDRKCAGGRIAKGKNAAVFIMFVAGIGLLGGIVVFALDAFSGVYYAQKLSNVLANAGSLIQRDYANLVGTADAMPRMISIVECGYVFLDRMIWGVGPGAVNPFSGVIAFLACYGLPAALAWLFMMKRYAELVGVRKGSVLFLMFMLAYGALLFGGGSEYASLLLFLGGIFTLDSNMAGKRIAYGSRFVRSMREEDGRSVAPASAVSTYIAVPAFDRVYYGEGESLWVPRKPRRHRGDGRCAAWKLLR